MKKLVSMLLVLIMASALLAGCGGTAGQDSSAASSEAASSESAAPASSAASSEAAAPSSQEAASSEESTEGEVPAWKEEHPGWLCEEKQTLTLYSKEQVSPYLNMSNDLYFWQWMEDYTNVHIEFELGTATDYTTLMTAKLAGGEPLADIMYVEDTPTGNDAGANGLLVDLAPYIDTCFPNTKAFFEEQGRDYFGDLTNPDGTFYGIRFISDTYENKVVPLYNTAWMKQLNLEIPTTLEEFDNVLRAMKDAGDLNGNGEADEIILSGPGLGDFCIGLAPAFDLEMLESEPALFAADESGTVNELYTTDNMKAMMSWLAGMYKEGILDPEITVNKSANMTEKVTADRVGVTFYYATYATTYGNMTSGGVAEPYSEQYTIGVPLGSEYNGFAPKIVRTIRYGNRFTAVSSDCENVELAARWLDTVYADPNALMVRCHGKEGETYYLDENGEPQIIMPADGSAWSLNPYGCGQINLAHMQLRDQTNFSRANLAPWWNAEYQVIRDGDWWIDPSVPKLGSKTAEEQMTYDMYWSEFNAGFQEYRDKFVTGELDVEADWDAYVATLKALGLDELKTGVFQSIYDRSK